MSSSEPRKFFIKDSGIASRVAIFLSGSGTNAENVLQKWSASPKSEFTPVCLVTDRPDHCQARELSVKFDLPLVSLDLAQFYIVRGQSSISLATEKGRSLREEWTAELYKLLIPFNIDFGIFAGFIPLTNITDHFPCLNVHPGDLTVCDDQGNRLLIGLHTLPVHRAIELGIDTMRTSVIVASTYEKEGAGMDEGHIIGLSGEVEIDWLGKDREYFLDVYKARGEKPSGGWDDEYQKLLVHNQEKLKVEGDWIVFPQVIQDFAREKFGYIGNKLFYKSGLKYLPINVVEYTQHGKEIIFQDTE